MNSSLPPAVLQATATQKLVIRNSRIKLPPRAFNVNQVMAAPPTVTTGTAATLTGQQMTAGSGSSSFNSPASSPLFTMNRGYTRSAGVYGAYVPFYNLTSQNGVSGTPTYGSCSVGWSFYHTGQNLELNIAGNSGYLMVKVDDQYVSLTPVALPTSGAFFYKMAFATRARRRIDIIGHILQFGGVNCDANDSIVPAENRGPRCIFLGDSFTAGTGASGQSTTGYVVKFADTLGWDDVWASGLGGTGYVNPGVQNGVNTTFYSRLQHDVLAFNPEIVWVMGGYNDWNGSYTVAQLQTAAQQLLSAIKAAIPNVLLVVSPNTNGGVGNMASLEIQKIQALQAITLAVGGIWIDPTNLPVQSGIMQNAGTLVNGTTVGGTTLQFPFPPPQFSTYLINSGGATVEYVQAKSWVQAGTNNYTATLVSPILNTHHTSETVTQTGGSYLTGIGYEGAATGLGNSDLNVWTDNVHPTDAGHLDLGQTLAALFMDAMASN
jgi:hypothetical protein